MVELEEEDEVISLDITSQVKNYYGRNRLTSK